MNTRSSAQENLAQFLIIDSASDRFAHILIIPAGFCLRYDAGHAFGNAHADAQSRPTVAAVIDGDDHIVDAASGRFLPLRQRMIDDMNLRNMSPATQVSSGRE